MREGSISRAAQNLHLSHPTISAQVKTWSALGERLFLRKGRTLALTDVGRLVYRDADEIFGIGRELMSPLRERTCLSPWLSMNSAASKVS